VKKMNMRHMMASEQQHQQPQHEDPEPIKLGQIRPDPVAAADSLTEADLPTFLRRSFPTR
jgi:hypothetical protein